MPDRFQVSTLLRLARLFDAPPDAAVSGDHAPEVARYLGRNLARHLRAVAEAGPDASSGFLTEGARVCGDLATLVACNPALLSPDRALDAAREAAAATREIFARTEGGISYSEADYLIRDIRGAVWRADLAALQLEEAYTAEEAGPEEAS